MTEKLQDFLGELKTNDLVHFIFSGVTIIGKFARVEKDSVILQSMASISGKRFAGETSIDIDKIGAWGRGGEIN